MCTAHNIAADQSLALCKIYAALRAPPRLCMPYGQSICGVKHNRCRRQSECTNWSKVYLNLLLQNLCSPLQYEALAMYSNPATQLVATMQYGCPGQWTIMRTRARDRKCRRHRNTVSDTSLGQKICRDSPMHVKRVAPLRTHIFCNEDAAWWHYPL